MPFCCILERGKKELSRIFWKCICIFNFGFHWFCLIVSYLKTFVRRNILQRGLYITASDTLISATSFLLLVVRYIKCIFIIFIECNRENVFLLFLLSVIYEMYFNGDWVETTLSGRNFFEYEVLLHRSMLLIAPKKFFNFDALLNFEIISTFFRQKMTSNISESLQSIFQWIFSRFKCTISPKFWTSIIHILTARSISWQHRPLSVQSQSKASFFLLTFNFFFQILLLKQKDMHCWSI